MGDRFKSFIEAPFEERNVPYSLVLIIGLSILIRMAFFTGFWGSDDVCYSGVANSILKGAYGISPHLVTFRVGLTYPTALFFCLFGVSERVAALFPILASVGCVLLACLIGRDLFNHKAGLLAGLLYAFFPLNVIFSTSLYPEVPTEFFLMLSLLFFLRGVLERAGSRSVCLGFLFLCGLSLGLGYLVKESVALMLFVYFGYFIYQLCANKKMRGDYLLIVFGFLLVFLAECWSIITSPANFFIG